MSKLYFIMFLTNKMENNSLSLYKHFCVGHSFLLHNDVKEFFYYNLL